MKRNHIVVFGGSNSKNSINKALATYTANQIDSVDISILDLNDFELPLFGVDLEANEGIPSEATRFSLLLESCDGIILSLAEHNGSYSAAFKNLLDWLSRIDKSVWKNKPMLLMATSPGGRGGATVLSAAKSAFPHFGGNVVASYSLPKFYENYEEGVITNEEFSNALSEQVNIFVDSL